MSIVFQRTYYGDLIGTPLDNGKVYVGEANKDPQTFPINCFWDSALTIPATQPLRTSAGYIINAGNRAAVYVAEDTYSLRVRTSADVLVDYIPDAFPELINYVTKTGTQTLSNKTFSGGIDFYTSNSRIGITSGSTVLASKRALLHVENLGAMTNGALFTSAWTGTTAAPYNNNDGVLIEVNNTVSSNSTNRSWGISVPNAYNAIPVGVTDSGERTAVYGWAGSVAKTGYIHAGTLQRQVGVDGRAGFIEAGSASTAVVNEAIGVRGIVINDVPGATVVAAHAGEFSSTSTTGTVQTNVGLYVTASGGTVSNYSFYGAAGKVFNLGQIQAKSLYTDSNGLFCAHDPGNSFEFGFPGAGYGSNIGSTVGSGYPFMAFCGEVEASGNTFRTRGNKAAVVWSDLTGALVFSRLTNASATGQSLTESARIDASGYLIFPSLGNYANDAAAAAGGVPVGGVYRNASVMMIRVV